MPTQLTTKALAVLDEMFPNHSIYRMDLLSGKKSVPRAISKTDIENWNSIDKKNEIYFTPNGEYALSNHVRRKEKARRMFCVFVEIDFDTPEEKQKVREGFDYEPTLVVETYKGYHVYRQIEPLSYEKHGGLRDEVQEMLCSFFGADKMARDAARLLRVPGNTYWKNGTGDFQIEAIDLHPLNMYDIKDFVKYFQPYTTLKEQEKVNMSKYKGNTYDTVQKINSLCDVRDVLNKLSGVWEVQPNGDIYEHGQPTDGYKYWETENALNCFSPHEDRPKGQPFSVAKHIIGNTPDAFEFFEKEYNIIAPVYIEAETTTVVKDETVVLQFDNGEVIIDWSDAKTKLISYAKKGESQKERKMLSGVIRPLGFFVKPTTDQNYYIIEYKTEGGKMGIKVIEKLGKGSELKTQLGDIGINLFVPANSKGVQELIQYIYNTNEEYGYIDYAGNIGGGEFIHRAGKYIKEYEDKKYYIDIDKTGSENGIMIHLQDDVGLDIVHANVNKLLETYEPRIVVSSMLWYMMTLFLPDIRSKFHFFPILNFVGESQAGKTTMRRLMMHLIGVSQDMEIQAAATQFSAMKMCTHALPLNVGEFENADRMYIDWDVFLKNNFDGTRNMRGTAGQKLNTYPNRAGICIDGELRSMNNAVYTRGIVLMMTKFMRRREVFTFELEVINGFFRENYKKISQLTAIFKESAQELHTTFKDVSAAEKGRMINNYALLDAFGKTFNIITPTSYMKEQLNIQIENMGDNTLERTIKKVCTLAYQQQFPAYLVSEDKTLVVETAFDTLRYSTAKIDEIRSHIQIVNHHFNPKGVNSEDDLKIPIDFLMGNPKLHNTFVKVLNYIARVRRIPTGNLGGAIKTFAEANKFTHHEFYDAAERDSAYLSSKKKKDEDDKGHEYY